MTIEGIPDGWDLIGIRCAEHFESFIDNDGSIAYWAGKKKSVRVFPIIRKIEKPKKYRPFANAAEFEPFRDRWIKRSYDGRTNAKGCFKVCGYDDLGVFNASLHESYEAMFEQGRQFDDGTPFGIEVTE